MGRPVVTAILLDDLVREGRDIRLATDALITPAARDWLKEHAVPVEWEDGSGSKGGRLAVVMDPTLPELRIMRTMLDRRGRLADVIEPEAGRAGVIEATRCLCERIARNEVAKGVVFAQDGALPVCIANKHEGIRAALGVNVPTVEEACRELGINVLVIEFPTQTAYTMREMIERMAAGPATGKPETASAIQAIEQGAPRADR